jgi:hypothetical protein
VRIASRARKAAFALAFRGRMDGECKITQDEGFTRHAQVGRTNRQITASSALGFFETNWIRALAFPFIGPLCLIASEASPLSKSRYLPDGCRLRNLQTGTQARCHTSIGWLVPKDFRCFGDARLAIGTVFRPTGGSPDVTVCAHVSASLVCSAMCLTMESYVL